MDLNMIKSFFLICSFIFAGASFAQDPLVNLRLFDGKVYSLKNKGIKDFVVDISSSKLAQQLTNHGTFGNVKNLSFRVFWTLNPERLDIEILGMPDGFHELKEELKLSVLSMLDSILPPPLEKKFAGYKFTLKGPGLYLAQDTTGVADIPSYILKFDEQNRLVSVEGQKPVGTLKISPVYEKDSFSDGRWVLKKQITDASEAGQTAKTTKTIGYGQQSGLTVVKSVTITTDQTFSRPEQKPVSLAETIEFKNYKIDQGQAMKHFIKDAPVAQ